MNKRREANKRLAHREAGHSEQGFRGSKGESTRSSGSHAHVGERKGPGEVPGAGELITPHVGPGKSQEAMSGHDKDSYSSRKTPSAGKAPNHTRGEEEDD